MDSETEEKALRDNGGTAGGGAPMGGAAATPAPSLLTVLRLRTSPYLPPPVVLAARRFDSIPAVSSALGPATGGEPCTALVVTLVMAYLTLRIVRAVGDTFGGRSTLHEDDEENYDVLAGASGKGKGRAGKASDDPTRLGSFGDTVALIGPSGSGKTTLFRSLCCGSKGDGLGDCGVPAALTVTSMKATAGVLQPDGASSAAVRVIDYPGHPSLRLKMGPVVVASARIVLALDSTRPVAEAASVLHSILTDPDVVSAWVKETGGEISSRVPVLVACAKSDAPRAKNWRRIKIQLRTELERLEKVGGPTAADSRSPDEELVANGSTAPDAGRLSLMDGCRKGGGLDLDNLGGDIPASLHFLSVGRSEGIDGVRSFVQSGKLPAAKK